jgi:hypothetical protein
MERLLTIWKGSIEMPMIEDQTKQLIDTLSDCLAKCEACIQDCADQGNEDLASCIKLCADCADLCRACISLLARGSQFSAELCRLCADACEQCAQECERTGMTECAETCRKAAEACRQMTGV